MKNFDKFNSDNELELLNNLYDFYKKGYKNESLFLVKLNETINNLIIKNELSIDNANKFLKSKFNRTIKINEYFTDEIGEYEFVGCGGRDYLSFYVYETTSSNKRVLVSKEEIKLLKKDYNINIIRHDSRYIIEDKYKFDELCFSLDLIRNMDRFNL